MRGLVKTLSGYGIPEEDICKLVLNPTTGKPIDAKTLRKHFRKELDTGAVAANAKVAGALFKMATGGTGQGAVTAAIFWLKTRARWKDSHRLELTGNDGGPIRTEAQQSIDLDSLSDEALAELEAACAKRSED